MKKTVLALSLLLLTNSFAQTTNTTVPTLLFPAGFIYSGNFWTASGTFGGSCLNAPDKKQVFLEFGEVFDSDLTQNIALPTKTVAPSCLDISLPFKKSIISIGYKNYYHSKSETDYNATYIPLNYTDYILKNILDINVHLFHGSISYTLNENYTFGISAGLTRLTRKDNFSFTKAHSDENGYAIKTGMTLTGIPDLQISYSISYCSEFNYNMVLEPEQPRASNMEIDSAIIKNNEAVQAQSASDKFGYVANLPLEIETGFRYQLNTKVTMTGKLKVQRWKILVNDRVNLVNYYVNARWQSSKYTSLNFGYFTQFDPFYENFSSYKTKDHLFITLGTQIDISNSLHLLINYMDSGVSIKNANQDYRKKYGSIGMAFTF